MTRATQLGVELDDVRQRIEPWYTDNRIECKMCTVEPGGMAAVRFAMESARPELAIILDGNWMALAKVALFTD